MPSSQTPPSQPQDAEEDRLWHALAAEEVAGALETDGNGLTEAEAERRLDRHGPNLLPEAAKASPLVRFFRHFHNVLIYVLIAAAMATAIMGHWVDTGVILAVVVVNAIIGFIQEGKAEQALEDIRSMLSPEAVAVRDGKPRKILAEKLVPGDLVELRSGDRVPADLRLTRVRNLKIEESPLTGESIAVEKESGTVDADSVVGDRTNIAFSGTMVTYGRGRGIVVATGASTEIGRISGMMEAVATPRTPLLRKIDHFGNVLSIFILGVTALFFGIGWFAHDYAATELFLAVIGLAVAAIPEGLPAIMTITLALGVQRMARRKAIVRKLPSVETLGSVTVICSDKTGTLTRNEMTARTARTASAFYEIEGTGYRPHGEIRRDGSAVRIEDEPALADLVRGAALCNDSEVEEKDGEWILHGEPTEGGLRVFTMKAGFDHAGTDRIDVLPFESDHKYMATLNEDGGGGRRIWVKGAPEQLLGRSSRQIGADGSPEDMDRAFWEDEIHRIAATGQRVLGIATRQSDHDRIGHDEVSELDFVGLVGMIDPPRDEAIEAVAKCRSAGIRVKMITGDHALTASGIARDLGLENTGEPVTGNELERMEAAELAEIVPDRDIFARTSPEHKLRLVEALQSRGEVAAMTGDGVNDAPAIKRADVGIAMGIKGTQVTKDVSEVVLADDNFATIAHAVEEGRTIYDNLRKTILFILPTNGAQSLVIMAAILVGATMPITPVQILWVNMITAVTLALALSFEPSEPGVMSRPPRDPREPILGGYFLWRIAFVSVLIAGLSYLLYFLVLRSGGSIEAARTAAVDALVAGQIFYLLNCRFMRQTSIRWSLMENRAVPIAIGVMVVLQTGFSYLPFMNTWFATEPPPPIAWAWTIGGGIAVFLLVEAEKALIGRRSGKACHE